MERDSDGAFRREATDALESLNADRDRLAQRLTVPWALMAAFGALGAWWVGAAAATNPGGDYEPPLSAWMALLGVLVVAHLVQRETGIRFRSMGTRANWLCGAAFAICAALFSVSLGFVSVDLRWPVIITSAAAFGITTWLAGLTYRAAVEHLRRG